MLFFLVKMSCTKKKEKGLASDQSSPLYHTPTHIY